MVANKIGGDLTPEEYADFECKPFSRAINTNEVDWKEKSRKESLKEIYSQQCDVENEDENEEEIEKSVCELNRRKALMTLDKLMELIDLDKEE